MSDAEEVTKCLETDDLDLQDRYSDCPVIEKPFESWNRGSICGEIFDYYHENLLLLQYNPHPLVFLDEDDLKKLLLVATDTFISELNSNSDVLIRLYAINFPLLASLDANGFDFLMSKLSYGV